MKSFLAAGLLAALCATAGANGRPAATSTINFEKGNPQNIVAGMTFGFLSSSDHGVTWKWMCEAAIGYSGTFDPDYAYTSSGAVFATTFNGLKVMRDGCTFNATPTGNIFVSAVEADQSNNVYVAAADPSDASIYKSSNDGMTFPQLSNPGKPSDEWDTVVPAPSNAMDVYLAGYRFNKQCSGGDKVGMTCTNNNDCTPTGMGYTCESIKQFLLFSSTNGGSAWTPMSQTGIAFSNYSVMDVVGVDPTTPTTLYLHSTIETGQGQDGIYKSVDSGQHWTKILTTNDSFGLVFLVRPNGDLVAATQTSGSQVSHDGGTTWIPMVSPPHINCLVNDPATGDLWACTHNYDSPGIPGDGFGIMKTSDYATWTGVLRFQDIAGVVSCPADSVQTSQCVNSYQGKPSVWCCLEIQLGITDTSVDCTGANDCSFTGDSAADAGNIKVDAPKGCCNTGGGGEGAALLAAGTTALLWRRRRK
ncbi:MAG: hypothetical protein QM831_10260 [Kofleriaceae bacterium]